MTISKTVKSIVISNNNFTIGYPGYELDGGVAVTANSRFLVSLGASFMDTVI